MLLIELRALSREIAQDQDKEDRDDILDDGRHGSLCEGARTLRRKVPRKRYQSTHPDGYFVGHRLPRAFTPVLGSAGRARREDTCRRSVDVFAPGLQEVPWDVFASALQVSNLGFMIPSLLKTACTSAREPEQPHNCPRRLHFLAPGRVIFGINASMTQTTRACILSIYNIGLHPRLYFIASALADRGMDVTFLSAFDFPSSDIAFDERITWRKLDAPSGFTSRIRGLRSGYQFVYGQLRNAKPDFIIAQHQWLVPAIAYKLTTPFRKVRIAAYFQDYYNHHSAIGIIKRFANAIDAYVDCCPIRVQWRQRDWPKMKAVPFVLRHAPHRSDADLLPHTGGARIVHTSSRSILELTNHERLARFLARLVDHGIALDWYFPGSEVDRSTASALIAHPLYRVLPPLAKSELSDTLSHYDAGLFWGPLTDRDPAHPYADSYFISAASNKVGEYLASGLVVARTDNPGLAFLPPDACAVFDPGDPEAGADHLARQLADRASLERKRASAFRFHREEMNFEAQTAPFIDYVVQGICPYDRDAPPGPPTEA